MGESGLDSSGNVTIRNAGQNQNQNQDEFIRPPRPSIEATNQERNVNNNTVNVIRSQSNLNQTNVTSRDFDLSNVNEMSITSLQKLGIRKDNICFITIDFITINIRFRSRDSKHGKKHGRYGERREQES